MVLRLWLNKTLVYCLFIYYYYDHVDWVSVCFWHLVNFGVRFEGWKQDPKFCAHEGGKVS